jgi:hypothetical protein
LKFLFAVVSSLLQEYVTRYADYLLNAVVHNQFAPFLKGFRSVCDRKETQLMMRLFAPDQVEQLICGIQVRNLSFIGQGMCVCVQDLDLKALEEGMSGRADAYQGYTAEDEPVK